MGNLVLKRRWANRQPIDEEKLEALQDNVRQKACTRRSLRVKHANLKKRMRQIKERREIILQSHQTRGMLRDLRLKP